MNSSATVCLILSLFLGTAFPATIPSNISGCKRDDPKLNKCAVETANKVYQIIKFGYDKYAVPNLDPFDVKSITISERNGQSLDLELKFKNVKFRGAIDFHLLKGSKFNLKERSIHFEMIFPTLTIDGMYEMDGRLLLIPIKGMGDANFTFVDMKISMDTDFTLHKGKQDKEYLQLVNATLSFTTDRLYVNLGNLFNGDKAIGDQINILFNENWKDMVTELRPAIRDTLKKVLLSIWNTVALRVPYDVLFPE